MSTKQEIITQEQADVVTLPAPASGSNALMSIIDRAATDPNFSVEKLEKLLAVKMQWDEQEARKAFVAARSAFKAEAPTVLKNKPVGFGNTKYDHATLDNVVDTITPVLAKHGLSHHWETEQNETGLIRVTCVLSHELGHTERVTLQAMPDTSGSKNAIQAIGSTTTYLERYTLLAATGVATKDQDDDGFEGDPTGFITDEQVDILTLKAEEVGANVPVFLKYMGVTEWRELRASKFNDALKALERKRQKEANNGNG